MGVFLILGLTGACQAAARDVESVPVRGTPCAPDDQGAARARLTRMLAGSHPLHVQWRQWVGLEDADPSRLRILTDDSICRRLAATIELGAPLEDYRMIFFRLDEGYIITVYASPARQGYGLTAVVDEDFDLVKPLLAD